MIIMFAAALALTACAGPVGNGAVLDTPTATPAPPGPVAAVELNGTKALIAAELAYNTAATAVRSAVAAGIVRPGTPLAEQLRRLNLEASRALGVARTARGTVERATAVSTALSAIADLRSATPGGPS